MPNKPAEPENAAKNTFSTTKLLSGGLKEALGIVQHRREEVVITHYNKPVAKIVPIPQVIITDPTLPLQP